MSTPFEALRPALEVLTSEANVLPATGQALEDYVTPDLEEVYNRVTGGRTRIEDLWETPGESCTIHYIPSHAPSTICFVTPWTILLVLLLSYLAYKLGL